MNDYLNEKHSERLLIRPLNLEDCAIWETFFQNPNSILYFPNFLTNNPTINARNWIEKQLERYKTGRYGLHALIQKETGEFIGQCGLLTQEVDGKTEIEIGYSLLPQFEGQGYASEAAHFFKTLAFEKNYTDSLISVIHVDNLPSQKVATRNGMTKTNAIHYHGIDVFIYRINRENRL